jgi:hypothetical protein
MSRIILALTLFATTPLLGLTQSTGSLNATIIDSQLTAVNFTIRSIVADDVLETLKKKYGPNVAVKRFQIQNGYGATLNYYVAVWAFPNLTVTLLSSTHQSLSDPVGAVTIQIANQVAVPKDKRAL